MLRLVEANDWLWGKWWPALLKLPAAQAHQDVGGSFASVFDTTAHMVGAELVWQERLEGNPTAAFPTPPLTMQDLYADWQAVAVRRKKWLELTSPTAPIFYHFATGTATNRVDEIVQHLTSHAHFHRGQLAGQFRMLGIHPPSAHLMAFFREK